MSSSNITDILAELIRGKKIGLGTVALAGELIAADARFNYRVLESKSQSPGTGFDIVELLNCYHEITGKLEEIVQLFELTKDHKSLDSTLIDMAGKINRLAR